MNDLVIRPAVSNDSVTIIDIHSRSIRALCSGDYSKEQLDAWIGKRTPDHVASRIVSLPFYVAELKGKLVGYAVYNPRTTELTSIYVDPDFSRQGIASRLMELLASDARRKGLTTLWLDASLTAVPFYESAGFKSIKETSHAFHGVPLECLRMELSLKD